MKLGLVGWASDTGVGREFRDALKNLPVTSAFVMPHAGKETSESFTGAVFPMKSPKKEMAGFLQSSQVDTVLTWETPGDWSFPALWKQCRIRWFHVVHWDWFHPAKIKELASATLIAPNEMCQKGLKERYKLDSVLLPVPVDTEDFPFVGRQTCRKFVSVYGRGGPHDRRALGEILAAWDILSDAPPELEIKAQVKPSELNRELPKGVKLTVGNIGAASGLYDGADVAIQPSRFEGVGVSLLEAQALGVPVITTEAEPMKTLSLPELRVRASASCLKEVFIGHEVEVHTPSAVDLAEKVRLLYGSVIEGLSKACSRMVRENYSWQVLRPKWTQLLESR